MSTGENDQFWAVSRSERVSALAAHVFERGVRVAAIAGLAGIVGLGAYGVYRLVEMGPPNLDTPTNEIHPTSTTKDPCVTEVATIIQAQPDEVANYGSLLNSCHQDQSLVSTLTN